MKFLLALSVLATTSVFANDVGREQWIKCYDTAQGQNREVVFKLQAKHHWLRVVYPFEQPLAYNEQTECLEYPMVTSGSGEAMTPRLRLCEGEGQRINGLVPIEAEYGRDEETVYCDRKIERYFRDWHPEM